MTVDRRTRLDKSSALPPPQRQLNMRFEARVLRGMTALERANVIARLTTLLLQAAGAPHGRRDDDEQ